MKNKLNQPIVHFILVAAFIFSWDSLMNRDEKEDILVSKQTQEFLFNQNKKLIRRDLSKEDKDEIINAYIQDELLLRMAYERGLDKIDARIRESLIKNVRGVLLSEVEDPDQNSLQEFLESNKETYALRSAVDVMTISVDGERQVDTVTIDSISYDLLSASYGPRYAGFIFNLPLQELSNPVRNGENLVQFKVLKYYTVDSLGYDSTRVFQDYKFINSKRNVADVLDGYAQQFNIVIE